MEFTTVLVANRGEIALRIMRGIREQGMRCVAVYSDADAQAPHVLYADMAVHIGRSPVGESYLMGEKIVAAALATGAEAVHPGYGLLSESADFARSVVAAGLVFIGPSPEAIEVMGDKAVSKRAMIAAGVPCVPGYQGEEQGDERLLSEAVAVGFPLMVKAASGGGGRGMRLVGNAEEVETAIKLARSEAESAFGNSDLILERAIIRPRHVEIQVFADEHGNVIHLGERDCSVQRRHQKVIEESPCPVMTSDLREAMGAAAVEAARAVNYVGAGTVEFLLDESGKFYFLEMNTRLQVEHPVTEMVTGLDLVKLQLEVAQGAPLNVVQSDIKLHGSAIEVRIYAEDPAQNFLPSTGSVKLWHAPEGDGIRVDAGITTAGQVSPFYDSMVAKVIAWGETRFQARQRLLRALNGMALVGPASNRDFLINTLQHPIFAQGEATTAFIGEVYPDGVPASVPRPRDIVAAAVLKYVAAGETAFGRSVAVPAELRNWSSTSDLTGVLKCESGGEEFNLIVRPIGATCYRVDFDNEEYEVEILALQPDKCRMSVNGATWETLYHLDDGLLDLCVCGSVQFALSDIRSTASGAGVGGSSPHVKSPMHGLVAELAVAAGDAVKAGDSLITLEAMKMLHVICAPMDAKVVNVAVNTGSQVSSGELLLELEAAED